MEVEAEIFKLLSNATRLRLMVLLSLQDEMCVCRLTEALDAPQTRVSRHLAVLRAARLVEARREGTWMYYRLAEPRNRLEECLHECFRECLADHKAVREDLKRLSGSMCAKR